MTSQAGGQLVAVDLFINWAPLDSAPGVYPATLRKRDSTMPRST